MYRRDGLVDLTIFSGFSDRYNHNSSVYLLRLKIDKINKKFKKSAYNQKSSLN